MHKPKPKYGWHGEPKGQVVAIVGDVIMKSSTPRAKLAEHCDWAPETEFEHAPRDWLMEDHDDPGFGYSPYNKDLAAKAMESARQPMRESKWAQVAKYMLDVTGLRRALPGRGFNWDRDKKDTLYIEVSQS